LISWIHRSPGGAFSIEDAGPVRWTRAGTLWGWSPRVLAAEKPLKNPTQWRFKVTDQESFRNRWILVALPRRHEQEKAMAVAKKAKTARGRKQDRARVAGGQDYEVRYEAKKTGKAAAVKKAVKKVGNARKRVEKRLGRWVGGAGGVDARRQPF
jgi:Protein of unknown function (DUF3606)